MNGLCRLLKCIVTFSCICTGQFAYAVDQDALDALFLTLSDANQVQAADLEVDIFRELSHSGSDAMDLLLERGQAAIALGDSLGATQHLTALIDHAPNFAEGYNSRATAYYMSGFYGLAMRDIAHTLALQPQHFGAISGMASILEEVDQPEKALAALLQIEDFHPHMGGLSQRISRLRSAISGSAL